MNRILILPFLVGLIVLMPLTTEAAAKKPNITCEVTASKTVIAPGEKVTLTWKSSGSIVTRGPLGTNVPSFGTAVVNPTKKTIYKFKFIGIGGNVNCGVRVRIAGEKLPEV